MEIGKNKRILLFLGGACILTLGVACIITANLGTGSWDGVNVGIGAKLSVPFGTIAVIVGILSAILAGILRKKMPNLFTVLTAFILGYLVNFWLFIISFIEISDSSITRWGLLILGILIQGIGMALYLLPEFAPNALDDAMMAIREKFGLSITVSKILFDTVGVIISFLVGGPIGIGTVIVTIVMGPYIDFWYRIIQKKLLARSIHASN